MKIKPYLITLATLFLFGIQTSRAKTTLSVIPTPEKVELGQGVLHITATTSIGAQKNVPAELTSLCASLLRQATKWNVPIRETGTIQFVLDTKQSIPKEGYELTVTKDHVQIVATTRAGLFYGFQTLRQLLPPAAFGTATEAVKEWSIPLVKITDAPRCSWRGVLVDVSRHFQTPQTIKKLLDAMAACKLNRFHWHLTDDQGWRVEIKKYPKLTSLSKPFYTQEEIRDVVAYAQARNIVIIPEIDVPGHSRAAIRAYPQLACRNKEGKKNKRSGTYCPSDPFTYQFLDNVFSELVTLFPGPWIHIGGDEVGTGSWRKCPDCQALMKKEKIKRPRELENLFIKRVVALVKKRGKQPITWDEAFHPGIDPAQIIMSWRGVNPGMRAAKAGHKVILCPVSALYFDRINSRSKNQRRGYSNNVVSLNLPYFFEARSPLLPKEFRKNILGAQGCIWGEKIRSDSHLLMQAMMRGCALAEATWSLPQKKDWPNFLQRVAVHAKRLDALHAAYFWEPASNAIELKRFTEKELAPKKPLLFDITSHVKSNTLYEFVFHRYFGSATFKAVRIELLENGKVIDSDTRNHVVTNDPRRPNQFFHLWVKNYKPNNTYTIRCTLELLGSGDLLGTLLFYPPLPPDGYSKWASPDAVAKDRKK